MNEIKDLVLKSTVIPAVMGFNYDQLNDQLDILLDDYRNLVVTDDTLQGCKNAKSGKRRALLSFPPLRTVRDSFPSYGSSLIKPIAATISRLYIIRIQI